MPCICLKSSGGYKWLSNLSDIKKLEGESSHNQHYASPWMLNLLIYNQSHNLPTIKVADAPKSFIAKMFYYYFISKEYQ